MSDENATKNEETEKPNEESTNQEQETGTGESGENAGADSGSEPVASEQGVSYEMLMEMLSAVQADQAKMYAQIQKLTDAQSVLVDAGAVVREGTGTTSSDATDDNNDDFVSIDELDLNL